MTTARLTVRWMGHRIGDIIHGRDAEHAIGAGVAEPVDLPDPPAITTGVDPSTTHTPPTPEEPDDEQDGDEGREGGDGEGEAAALGV